MISSVTIVARACETTERTRTEGRKDRKGIGADQRVEPDRDGNSDPRRTSRRRYRVTPREP